MNIILWKLWLYDRASDYGFFVFHQLFFFLLMQFDNIRKRGIDPLIKTENRYWKGKQSIS